jgi:hypothetical protein
VSKRHIPTLAAVCLLVLAAYSPLSGQSGAHTASVDLAQLVQGAQTIVRGQVLSAKIEPHPQFPNLQTVVVTLAVTRLFKGDAKSQLVFRQYVWDPGDFHSAAGYQKAGELLLFLNPVSPYGLTSPVGLEQGRFRVLRDAKGNRYALNGKGNFGLFAQVADKAGIRGASLTKQAREILAKPAGQAPLDAFEEIIQALATVSR